MPDEIETPLSRSIKGFNGTSDDLQLIQKMGELLADIEGNLGQLLSIYSQVNWSSSSPDGQIGGRGYIIGIDELREFIVRMITDTSKFKNAVRDECSNNPHWEEHRAIEEVVEKPEPIDPEYTPLEKGPLEIEVNLASQKPPLRFSHGSVREAFRVASDRGVRSLSLGEICYALDEMGTGSIYVDRVSTMLDQMVKGGILLRDKSGNYHLK